MTRSCVLLALAALGVPGLSAPAGVEAQASLRYPNVGANRIRVEHHLLPSVTTGPLDPAWSPDGRWIAFSMAGDIWKIPAAGGTAVALTSAPGYHFEPAWSPDGRWIALTIDVDGNLDIGLVSADGGAVEELTTHPHVDIEPEFTRDGSAILFASARAGSFDLYRIDIDTGDLTTLVDGPGHQVQPAISPDGRRMAYLGPVEGRLGTGGIWTAGADGSDRSLVHYEETSYRTQPSWSPDGARILFVSDEAGSNDVVSIPADGGTTARLTSHGMNELGPVTSPDGSRIAFTSNQDGPQALFVMPAGGAREEDWAPVPVSSRAPRTPSGRVRIRITDASGQPLPARIYLEASDGRGYAPVQGFHRVISETETHYFHADGAAEVDVPVGPVTVRAMGGLERVPAEASTSVVEGQTAQLELRLDELLDATERGWYSGETHAHDLHQGRFGLSHGDFFLQLVAEDLRVTNALIHMDGTRIMGRWSDLTGSPHPLSTSSHILQYAQEFRGSFGHVGLLGVSRFEMPLIGGTPYTVFDEDVLNRPYLEAARAQGGIGGYMHPFTRPIDEPADAADNEIPLDVVLGSGVFYDVLNIWYDELVNAGMYYRLLNTGARLASTAGSDNFADVYRDPPPGTTRTYARVEGPLTVSSWLEAVEAGRTFGTSGPLLFLTVDGHEPGTELETTSADPSVHKVRIEIATITPLDRVEVVANGRIVETVDVTDRGDRFEVTADVSLPAGGWILARAIGPSSPWVADTYAFAHTSPVYVVRDGRPYLDAEDAVFLRQAVEALGVRATRRDTWVNESARVTYMGDVEAAIARYRDIEARARER